MLRLPWFTFKKEKGEITNAETFGTVFISDRFEDGKPRLMVRDSEGNESMLVTETIKEGEGEDAKITIQTIFQRTK